MAKLDELKQKVSDLYLADNENRDPWASWLYSRHVLVVADYAKELAVRYGADSELSEAAALLHDIADSVMLRENPKHEEESLAIARRLMEECGYSAEDIALVVDDADRLHSCHDGQMPKSKEGQVLATADSLAHLKTDFYVYTAWALGRDMTLEEIKDWTLKKIERDLNNKILFDEAREEVRPDYEMIKNLFSR